MASSGDEDIPLHLYHAIIRGLERLVVSFSLSREDSDFLVKFSVDRCGICFVDVFPFSGKNIISHSV